MLFIFLPPRFVACLFESLLSISLDTVSDSESKMQVRIVMELHTLQTHLGRAKKLCT